MSGRLLLFIYIGMALASLPARAQDSDNWYRLELGASAGLGFTLDDCNGKAYGSTRPAVGLVARFPLNPRMAVKTGLTYLSAKGTTADVADFYPSRPDGATADRLAYTYSGGIVDCSGLFELNFLPYGWERGYQGYKRVVPYFQFGFGVTYGTAGKAFTANIPIGVGAKWKIGRRLNLGLDWRFHFTLSDKLDGLEAPKYISTGGFKNKDHYNATLITLTYDLSPKCPTCNKD